MEKKPYHHKNLKNDLIEKGIELVNKNGINQLSLRKVAQACGVSHAAPYSHFSNKEELLQEMQLHITKKFTEVLENTVSQYRGTPIFLLEFGKAYISFFISHPQYFNFLFQQGNIQIDLNIDYLYIDIVRNLFLKNNRINCISHAHFYYWFEFFYRWVILKKVHHY